MLAAAALVASLGVSVVQAEEPLDSVAVPGTTEYPDLQPDVQFPYIDIWNGPPQLLFDTWSNNLGTVDLQVTASPSDDPLAPNVNQCVSWYAPRVCREFRPVGGFEWHDQHTHFHYKDFATYTFRRTVGDTVDWSDAGEIDISEKVSTCLIDVQKWDEASTTPQFYTLGNCYAPAVMGISPGWADVYDASIPGQEFSMAGVSDGRYAIVVDLDPVNRLFETDNTNNRVILYIDISGVGTALPFVTEVRREWPTTGEGGTTTTTTSTTTSTSTSTTSTTVCRGGGGGGGGGGPHGGGGGGGGKCR